MKSFFGSLDLRRRPLRAVIVAAFVAAAPDGSPAAESAAPVSADLAALVQQYDADRSSLSRFYELPWSETRFDRLERLQQEWREQLNRIDFEALDPPGRIDFILLRNEIASALDRVNLLRGRLNAMENLVSFRVEIQRWEQARWRMKSMDPAECASTLASLPDQVRTLRERIEAGRKAKKKDHEVRNEAGDDPMESPAPLELSPALARRAAEATGEIRGTLRHWFEFYDGFQPGFSWWLKKPFDDANQVLEDYSKFLREEVAGLKGKDDDPLVGDPVGADVLKDDLAAEMIAYSPEELIAIGEREFAWCESEMKKAARDLGLGEDWKKALDRVKSQYVPPGEQDDLIDRYARETIRFVRERDLITIPPLCEETWRVTMLSPDAQKTLPYAAYGGQSILVAYAREDMKHEDKLMAMRGNNRHSMRFVTAHELIPGHHLQAFVSARNRPYRRVFTTPFFVEGWPLYWEMKLWDLGFAKSPEDRVGALFWRMHRAARIIVSLKFHLGEMKPGEMVDFLVDRVGHERLGATSEVRRFIGDGYSPLYQCGYMIGGLQLRALHREVVGGGRMTEREFNDTVLTLGAIPIELIRAAMLHLPLTRGSAAQWRFAGEIPETKQGGS